MKPSDSNRRAGVSPSLRLVRDEPATSAAPSPHDPRKIAPSPAAPPIPARRDAPPLKSRSASPGTTQPQPGREHRARLASQRVAYENACAAMIQPADVRWIFAMKVGNAIEGGRAALLTPPKRRELIAVAVSAGLREFDANLVIAVVQDAARRGELGEGARAAAAIGPSLAMVGGATPRRPMTVVFVLAATILVSFAFFAALVYWLLA